MWVTHSPTQKLDTFSGFEWPYSIEFYDHISQACSGSSLSSFRSGWEKCKFISLGDVSDQPPLFQNIAYYTLRSELRVISLSGTGTERRFELGGVLEDTPTALAFDWSAKKVPYSELTGFWLERSFSQLYIAITTTSSDHPARIQVSWDYEIFLFT